MNGNTRKKRYDEVARRDGNYCRGCQRLPTERPLVLDHIDNNPKNNKKENLQILCRKCNYEKNPRGPVDLCENENENESENKSELQVNKVKEPKFKSYVHQRMWEEGQVPQSDIINSGAEHVGISPITAKRYLDKMCSSAGTLQRRRVVETIIIEFKKELRLTQEGGRGGI